MRVVGTKIGAAVVFLLAGLMTSCASGTSYEMESTQQTPAAAGDVEVSTDDNGNTVLNVTVEHLPPPTRISDELETYVAWVNPVVSDSYTNLGMLRLGDDCEAEIETRTPFQDFQLLVTAEESGAVSAPSDNVVLQRRVSIQK